MQLQGPGRHRRPLNSTLYELIPTWLLQVVLKQVAEFV